MGIFNSGKKDAASQASKKSMNWDKIYVEIDNDANGTVAGKGLKSAATSRIQKILGTSSALTDSKDEAEIPATIVPNQPYKAMEDEDENNSCDTEARSNIHTVTSGTYAGNTVHSDTYAGNTVGSKTYDTRTYDSRTFKLDDDIETAMGGYTATNDDKYLSNNHFANAQLMRWKHTAEEGPAFIQVFAFLSAMCSIFTTVYPLVIFDSHWTIPMGVCAYHTIMLCSLIIAFEIRAWGIYRNPMGLRARVRNLLSRYLNILKFLWGRGFLYMFAGSMNIAMNYSYAYVSGLIMMGLGALAIMLGASSSLNLERLRLSLTDHSYLWGKFGKADSDHDNMIDIGDFSDLIWSLGLELDDAYTYRAFAEIDQDGDKLIDFDEFKSWWINSQDDDGTVLTMDMTRFSSSKISKLTTSQFPSKYPSHKHSGKFVMGPTGKKIPKNINAY